MGCISRFRERKKLLLYDPANHSARFHFLVESLNRRTENDSGRSHRAFNVRTSRDLGNAKSCCFTIQPITALNFIFLVESLNRRTENDSGNAERQMWNCNEKKR